MAVHRWASSVGFTMTTPSAVGGTNCPEQGFNLGEYNKCNNTSFHTSKETLKRLVSKYTISGANYQNAWSTLANHFDKKRYTVFSLVHEFLSQSPITQANSQSLSRLVTTSDEIIQQMDALGPEFTGRDPWLIHLILEKLDKETRTSWSHEVVDTDDPTFNDLLEFLKSAASNNGELVDPQFNRPSAIDIILGADVFLALLEGGQVKNESGHTVAQRTVFGWIVAGQYDASGTTQSNHTIVNLHVETDLNRTLQQFWEQEEIFKPPSLTLPEQQVIEHFNSTLQRDETGRFIVRLPFDDSKPALGDSLAVAYTSFMHEYMELGHMEEVPSNQVERPSSECFYLPHHAVIKNDSLTTKLRVVFDASCASSSGVSLNDRLLAGPNNNSDLFEVSLRFRSHRVAFFADVTKMYRQVLVHPMDRDFQRIVFREEPDQPIRHYRLCTVTYGTKTAPYLAIESMREATKSFESMYPQAVEAIKRNFHVDDFLSGAEDEEKAIQLKNQVVEILSSAGFELRKWSSNNRNLLPNNDNDKATPVPVKMLNDSETVKALGINWYPSEDKYGFKVNFSPFNVNTKRQMISDSARTRSVGWRQ
ncbi:uncharacterized protein LOC134206317 [Armigeres subalbatus]|uniref:uncharacterized protein LOC134206317 n=1 Tax=Armigeres subalbatus TaxID=124917 RepID=UPI002ED4AF77